MCLWSLNPRSSSVASWEEEGIEGSYRLSVGMGIARMRGTIAVIEVVVIDRIRLFGLCSPCVLVVVFESSSMAKKSKRRWRQTLLAINFHYGGAKGVRVLSSQP